MKKQKIYLKILIYRTYIVTSKNDFYRNRQKNEFIVIDILLVYRKMLNHRKFFLNNSPIKISTLFIKIRIIAF
jgi:hypothetical protein